MSKISKNIKKLRVARKLSQDDLAKMLFISRQAVSSWEVGRTQPDLEMIGKLSEIFGVPTEELLYGAKRNTALEESVKNKKTLSVIFAILGSLLVGVGIMIILIGLWEEFSNVIKSIVSLMPLLIGQGTAYFVYRKKFDTVSWREGGAVLWSVGVIATVGLMSMVNNLYLGVTTCLLIDAIMILPIIYIFKVISPLAFYFGFSIAGVVGVMDKFVAKDIFSGNLDFLVYVTLMAMFVAAGIGVAYLNRKDISLNAADASVWICGLGVIAATVLVAIEFQVWGILLFLFPAMLLLGKKETWLQPYYPIGVLLTCIGSLVSTYFCISSYDGLAEFDKSIFTSEFFGAILVSVVFALVGFIVGAKNYEKKPLKIVFCGCGMAIGFLVNIWGIPIAALISSVAVFVLTFVEGAVLIVKGANEKSYFTMNVGIITILVLLFQILLTIEMTLITVGLMLLLSGGSLLTANVYITKQIKKEQAELDASKSEDEGEAQHKVSNEKAGE